MNIVKLAAQLTKLRNDQLAKFVNVKKLIAEI